ncbi:MAG: Do family serine endopeptidase [Spirochaetaceae bacterium]|nr:MAG: Do family serine endopeptidase [Spirochaetaceae bacterium]
MNTETQETRRSRRSETFWKKAFFSLAGVFGIFAVGLVVGLSVAGGNSEAPQPTMVQAQGGQIEARWDRDVQPLPEGEDGSFASVAATALPVVVEVNVVEVVEQRAPSSPFEFFFGPRDGDPEGEPREFERPGLGSGVIVRRNGENVYILTNHHVVGNASEIEIGLYDGRRFTAELVGGDPRTDLAVLNVETSEDVPVARLGDSDALSVGDWVLAVGNPFGFDSTVTAGIVSATGRRPQQAGGGLPELTDFIQTDAAINPGNSGGALVNMSGEIVGINTWIVGSQTGGSVGLGFAIPMSQAADTVDQFITEGRIVYGWLGVSITDADSPAMTGLAEDLGIAETDGALITNVWIDSPAHTDGIRPGDFVVEIDGVPVADTFDLQRAVGAIRPGETGTFRVIRDGAERTIDVTIAEREAEDVVAVATNIWPGLTVVPVDDDLRERHDIADDGALVAVVERESSAARAGIQPGDVITHVDDERIDGAREFYAAAAEASGRLELRVARNGVTVSIGLPAL